MRLFESVRARWRAWQTERCRISAEYNEALQRHVLGPNPLQCTCWVGKRDPECPWHTRPTQQNVEERGKREKLLESLGLSHLVKGR